jgi:hypothetical protein
MMPRFRCVVSMKAPTGVCITSAANPPTIATKPIAAWFQPASIKKDAEIRTERAV